EPAGTGLAPARSRYFEQLLEALSRRGIIADSRITGYIQQRIEVLGKIELRKLVKLAFPERDSVKIVRRLGWGFAITEFLAAPVFNARCDQAQICSLGALVNLMVVTCDRLLDEGKDVESVLP